MERISKKSVATSKPFKFIVGPQRTEFTIHSALVGHQSPALLALVNGQFKESSDCSVKWDDIDEIVFTSFWQFVYTGDYDTPEPLPPATTTSSKGKEEAHNPDEPLAETTFSNEPVEKTPTVDEVYMSTFEEESVAAAEPTSEDYIEAKPPATWYPSLVRMKKKKKVGWEVRKTTLWEDFQASWEYPSQVPEVDRALKVCANPLVHHARVYTLADRYWVTRLMQISHEKIHGSLVNLRLDEEASGDVVELVRFAFEELVPDQLRNLVVHYAACVVEHLWKDDKFQELVQNNGALSRALVGRMVLRFD
ncbi:hypothetical protein Forpi1262_v018700 [Fusarium oxysporum f. sp. raphani]|uniref:BTB domain-containing protein n=2 Tax=Fusarium oxysporum TaxID=5507 RepID=A0A8J5TXM2_FUSOX|nr:hypothetical protein FocnCong_v020888 [Fusarium oxysporum f. sp. conglutinans]KAG7403911.1 hypothetical protein Forpi1262_v018700 [Fusarium oxysporum f. sp. raphani]